MLVRVKCTVANSHTSKKAEIEQQIGSKLSPAKSAPVHVQIKKYICVCQGMFKIYSPRLQQWEKSPLHVAVRYSPAIVLLQSYSGMSLAYKHNTGP